VKPGDEVVFTRLSKHWPKRGFVHALTDNPDIVMVSWHADDDGTAVACHVKFLKVVER